MSAPIDYNVANTDIPAKAMELTAGNIKLRIPNGTDPMLLAQTIKLLMECAC